MDVTIPDGVEIIGDGAFENTNLTSVTLPDSVTQLGENAFIRCENLSQVRLSNRLTTLEYHAFSECDALTGIDLPSSLTTIGNRAFEDAGLTSIAIPGGVTSIGKEAFRCSNLTDITIPDTVTGIGEDAFFASGYYFEESNWQNDVLYIDHHLVNARSSLSGDYEVLPGTKTIAEWAFYGCHDLTGVTVPDSVVQIGYRGFGFCNSLTRVTLSDSLTRIESSTFIDCPVLADIHLPKNLKSIGSNAFSSCKALTDLVLPEGLTTIEEDAFMSCENLISIVIPQSVTYIGEYAFANDNLLTIRGYAGSVAEAYAGENDIPFVALNPPTPVSLSIAALPYKTAYLVGEEFTYEGLALTLTYSNGGVETITQGFTVGVPNLSTPGQKTVTVSYAGLETSFAVVVSAPPLSSYDFNGDGSTDVADAMFLAQRLVAKTAWAELDLNADGTVDVLDVMTLVQLLNS